MNEDKTVRENLLSSAVPFSLRRAGGRAVRKLEGAALRKHALGSAAMSQTGKRISFEDLVAELASVPSVRSNSRRLVVVTGAPGSGKSTIALAMIEALNATDRVNAAVLPMDGYHYDDRVLEQRGLLARKGAPNTFDVSGLGHMLARLRSNDEAEIAVPVFDRELEISRAGAKIISRSVDLIVVEGNYLLLDYAPWASLSAYFDRSVFIDVPEDELRTRLNMRWQRHGIPVAEITEKVERNDIPNGREVVARSAPADFVLTNSANLSHNYAK
jgi:pantothenate kinase